MNARPPLRLFDVPTITCSWTGCDNPPSPKAAKRRCQMHQSEYRRRLRRITKNVCFVDGCARTSAELICGKHRTDRRRYGLFRGTVRTVGWTNISTTVHAQVRGQLLKRQNGKCALCSTTEAPGGWCLDHNHRCQLHPPPPTAPTGGYRRMCSKCIRGVLCHKCNSSLGGFNDDPELLRHAAEYVTKGFLK